ncbi:MAG: ABC transporter substrate-binding protein [Anaerolineae bacterium]|nr:ABC transporter substrate-binding protein [Anaerolineae bacterium]
MSHNQKTHDTKRRLSRREFLKVSAAGLAASSVASIPMTLTPAQAAAVRARQQAGALRIAWGGAPATLDPLSASADTEIAFLNAVYDYLIDTNAQNELVPRLATGWEVSEDGLEYTLQIAEGVTFHDGSDLTVDDIVWTFERLKSGGPTADLYAGVEVEAGEGNSVVFRLSGTNPDFLFDLTDNHAVILKAGAEGIGETFNGTGPFVLQEYATADRAIFTANADYFGGAPGVETLEFQYFGDNTAAINALRGGVVDVVLRMDEATFLTLSGEGDFATVQVATNGHDLVRLRADREPGSDERVRRAFKLATDRADIFQTLKYGFGAEGARHPHRAAVRRLLHRGIPAARARPRSGAGAARGGGLPRRPGDDALRAQPARPRRARAAPGGAVGGGGHPHRDRAAGRGGLLRGRRLAGGGSGHHAVGFAPRPAALPGSGVQDRRGVERGALQRRRA